MQVEELYYLDTEVILTEDDEIIAKSLNKEKDEQFVSILGEHFQPVEPHIATFSVKKSWLQFDLLTCDLINGSLYSESLKVILETIDDNIIFYPVILVDEDGEELGGNYYILHSLNKETIFDFDEELLDFEPILLDGYLNVESNIFRDAFFSIRPIFTDVVKRKVEEAGLKNCEFVPVNGYKEYLFEKLKRSFTK